MPDDLGGKMVETTDLRRGLLVIDELRNEEKRVLGGVGGGRCRDKLS